MNRTLRIIGFACSVLFILLFVDTVCLGVGLTVGQIVAIWSGVAGFGLGGMLGVAGVLWWRRRRYRWYLRTINQRMDKLYRWDGVEVSPSDRPFLFLDAVIIDDEPLTEDN